MNNKSPFALGLAVALSLAIVAPPALPAEPQAAQRAGVVDRVIPAVNIARGPKTLAASAKTVVDWQDLVNTQANARARVALDDGSVLNVGSDSSLRVIKHDPGAQQTELELAYGKLRTQAQKIGKPDGKFEVRSAAGVAGVVGTDFYADYDTSTKAMNVIVYEGSVRFCNLAGACVVLKAGQLSTVRNGDKSAPAPPAQAPLDMLVTAGKDTDVGARTAPVQVGNAGGVGLGLTFGIIAVAPIIVFSVLSLHKTSAPPPQTAPGNGCVSSVTCG